MKLMLMLVGLLLAGCTTPGPRGRVGGIVAAHEARQVALACFVWANEHQGQLPESLAVLKDYTGLQNLEAFELVAKGKLADLKEPAATVLVREKQASPGARRAVAYADGHADLISIPKP